MCGFAGVVAWEDKYRVTREMLARMSAAVAHRGPDGEGMYLNHEQEVTPGRPQVGLAFRRLAILDPDPRSNQPFTDGRHWLVFNGEIYNFRELREELKAIEPTYEWRTTGDTEVLLRAYALWGKKCVEHLNGMFAFAIWDEHEQSLFLARDRMGQKPLYYTISRDRTAFAFASELRALRPLEWFERTVDPAALGHYLRMGYIPWAQTIHPTTFKLPPASRELITRSRMGDSESYFSPNARQPAEDVSSPRPTPPQQATRNLVMQAVRRQLVSDVPLGCFLSGGIDSSVIAAAMKACVDPGQEVLTFSIGFDDPRYDETRHAAEVAGFLGTKHRQFIIKPDAAADLPRLAAVYGEPFGDSSALPTHYLSRETRRHVKVALSGDGGDEFFGGYDRYQALRFERRLRRIPRPLRGLLAGGWAEQLPSSHPPSVASKVKRFLKTIDQPAAKRYASYMRLFDDAQIASLLTEPMTLPDDYIAGKFEELAEDRDPVESALATDRVTYLPEDLLTKVDRASMLHALEVRSPFMDHELVQFAARLKTDQLLRGGPKRMLREAFAANLPDFVFKRRKMGFAVPIGEWFRGELRPLLRDYLFAADSFARQYFNMKTVERMIEEHENFRVDHSQRLYALLMLELWWRLQMPGS